MCLHSLAKVQSCTLMHGKENQEESYIITTYQEKSDDFLIEIYHMAQI